MQHNIRRFLLTTVAALGLFVALTPRTAVAQQTATDAVYNCLDRAADAFHACTMGAQEYGWFVRNFMEFGCGITYGIDGVACLPVGAAASVVSNAK
ncbi:MAG: hypothetical protein IT357_10585 [Gemmatimonadaceae bacterium]|nr:hypothetical protein [Gemmatimonadaceae bacterium]